MYSKDFENDTTPTKPTKLSKLKKASKYSKSFRNWSKSSLDSETQNNSKDN